MEQKARGLSLFSGGLDSLLAVCILREQGCQMEAVTFASPFFNIEPARKGAAQIGVPLRVIDFTTDIAALVRHPPHGFGGAVNPCIDCHATMIKRAGEIMREMNFDFVSTGEVLNQRPMSQNMRSLSIVAKDSGLEGRLLRPLSAQLLEPTIPEQEGLIDRSKLYAIEGRNRQIQKKLAEEFGIKEYPAPAGGCRLTEKMFGNKVKDLRDHDLLDSRLDIDLLLLGRHFRLPGGAKFIIGRNASENLQLQKMAGTDYIILHPLRIPGPTTLLSASASPEDVETATALCAGYSDTAPEGVLCVRKAMNGSEPVDTVVKPMPREDARKWLL